MASLLRAIFGASPPKPDTVEDGPLPVQETLPLQNLISRRPVPLDASRDAADGVFECDFNEQHYIVPANDGNSVVLFPATFRSESAGGTAFYDEVRADDEDPRERVETAIQIYNHLKAHGPLHPRLADYMGKTASGYLLERVAFGSLTTRCPPASLGVNNVALALYQRWALQILSALTFLHRKNVFLNNVGSDTWLRSDYSIVIANMINAGCAKPSIAGQSSPYTLMASQWSPESDEAGSIKNDLFDWASWVFTTMTGGEDALLAHMGVEGRVRSGTDEFKKRMILEQDVARGAFDSWPRLDERMLGSVIVKAWRGEYGSATQALQDARGTIEACGHKLSESVEDEVEGYDWQTELEVARDDKYGLPVLRLRSG